MLSIRLVVIVLCTLLGLACPVGAAEYSPTVGQPGKDVIWVPTPDALVARMLDMAKVTPQDYLVDLGSGDGRTVIAAAKRGIKALGIEYNPDMVAISTRNAQAAGVGDRAKFIQGDIFATDFSDATVVTMYLLSSLNLKLRPTLLNMKPGTRLVSHAFTMGDWAPDETASIEGYTAYLWIVPAKMQGSWQVSAPFGSFDLALDQTFQKLTARVARGGLSLGKEEPTLRGNALTFTVLDSAGRAHNFRGSVNADAIEGSVRSADKPEGQWTGRRVR